MMGLSKVLPNTIKEALLLERSTTSHLVVGIHIAKETHVAQATNFRCIVLSKRHLSFSNTIEGFEKLERWIDGISQKHRLKDVFQGDEILRMSEYM
jgi:streptomycin 6-kinase